MKINFLVVRQASTPEAVQRWILTDPDEYKKKLDASTKSASESFKARDLSSSHGDPESTKEDDDKGQEIGFKSEQVH